MSAAATPASANAASVTSTISCSMSLPSCLPNLLCAQPTMHPLMTAPSKTSDRMVGAGMARPPPRFYVDMGKEMAERMDEITLRRPDDWHVHLRDGAMLSTVLPFTARQFARAIVMPNLASPVTDIAAARAYRRRIIEALPAGADFTPLMTCYLTDTTLPDEVAH